jgi:hypothetical protein
VHKSIVFIAAAIWFATPAAKAETAVEVRESCKPVLKAKVLKDDYLNFPGNFETGFCWGAFASLQKISTFYREGETSSLLGSCAPPDSDRLQYIRIFSKYLDEHPALGEEDYVTVAIEAINAAFPCPKIRTALPHR